MKKLIIFNWKMNPASPKEAVTLFNSIPRKIKNSEIVVAAPFVYLNNLKSKIKLATQNVFWEDKGAFTGEISPLMLKNMGVEYAIIGHSERRKYLNETDEMINKKVSASLKVGLKVILCVGEDLKIRNRSIKAVKNFVKNQLKKDLKGIKNKNLIIAYEPIWAIGTGRACPPKDALEMTKFIKIIINTKVIYGGSVDSKNIKDFVKYKEIDGALVGGASLKPKEVKRIIKSL